MAPQSVGDFGVLHMATVRSVETVGTEQAVIVECPSIAPGQAYGPVPSLVPALEVAERVLMACVGTSISHMIILQRWTPRWPRIAEVPGLSDRLGELATDADLDLLTQRVDRNVEQLSGTALELDELENSLAFVRSRLEELPEAFGRQQASIEANGRNITANSDAAAALRTDLYGSPDRTWRPRCEMRMTADINNLAASTDYLLVGSFSSFRDTELANGKEAMLIIGNSAANPSRVRIPADGEYDIEYAAHSSATTGLLACGVILNGTYSNSVVSQVANQSIFRFVVGATGEGAMNVIKRRGQFSAGDLLTFSIWSSVAFNLTATYFGAVRTHVKVSRIGS